MLLPAKGICIYTHLALRFVPHSHSCTTAYPSAQRCINVPCISIEVYWDTAAANKDAAPKSMSVQAHDPERSVRWGRAPEPMPNWEQRLCPCSCKEHLSIPVSVNVAPVEVYSVVRPCGRHLTQLSNSMAGSLYVSVLLTGQQMTRRKNG